MTSVLHFYMKTLDSLCLIFLFFCAQLMGAEVSPRDRLMTTVDAAMDVLYDECCKDLPTSEKQVKVRAVIEGSYNLTVLIRRAMGRNWSRFSDSEQIEVIDLIKSLIVKAYVQNLGELNRPEISFGDTVKITDKRIEIPSTIISDGNKFFVLYRLGRMRSGWEIYDIVAEDISVVSNYRQQFDDHFRRGNGQQLIEKLRALFESDKLNEKIEL